MAEEDRFSSTHMAHYKDPRSYGMHSQFQPRQSRDSEGIEKQYRSLITAVRSRNTHESDGKEKMYHASCSEEKRYAGTINIPSERSIVNPSFENNPSKKHAGKKDSLFRMNLEETGMVSKTADNNVNSRSNRNILGFHNTTETKDVYFSRSSGAHQADEQQRSFNQLEEQIKATIYGQCLGDAIGLLTEFMSKEEARENYGDYADLSFSCKIHDRHRDAWATGDWTDDSDHMLLIMRSLISKQGKVDANDFARKLYEWSINGFPELHDVRGMGLGRTTHAILSHPGFLSNPEKVSQDIWRKRGCVDAPNGGVMRTAILGIHEWWDVERVEKNAVLICRTTHFDPRCVASVVAVSVAISMMLKRQVPYYDDRTKEYNVKEIIQDSYQRASKYLVKEEEKKSLHRYMTCEVLPDLKLDDVDRMGYTFKCLGAGFWGLKQDNFRSAIQKITMEGGDADTNCAVAGALLGCKLGDRHLLSSTWMSTLANKSWLRNEIERYLELHRAMYRSVLQDGGRKPYTYSRY